MSWSVFKPTDTFLPAKVTEFWLGADTMTDIYSVSNDPKKTEYGVYDPRLSLLASSELKYRKIVFQQYNGS